MMDGVTCHDAIIHMRAHKPHNFLELGGTRSTRTRKHSCMLLAVTGPDSRSSGRLTPAAASHGGPGAVGVGVGVEVEEQALLEARSRGGRGRGICADSCSEVCRLI
jgi:hypothetical protein